MFDTAKTQSWLTKNNLFLIFGYVHILKNIGNIWIADKIQELKHVMDDGKKIAEWSNIKKLYTLEANNLTKLSKLTEVSVMLLKKGQCMHVFNDATVRALKIKKRSFFSNYSGILKIFNRCAKTITQF